MKIDKERLDKQITRAKKLIARAVRTKDRALIGGIEKLDQEICLVVASFKCQKCGSGEDLTLHHLITRHMKPFMDFWRYVSQRHYWANQIILCDNCEKEAHNFNPSTTNRSGFITKRTINRIKNKYLIKPKSAELSTKEKK